MFFINLTYKTSVYFRRISLPLTCKLRDEMKNKLIAFAFTSTALLISCSKNENFVVKKSSKMHAENSLKGVSVVNALDPICEMPTSEYLKDTVHYGGKVYGFCSDHCKSEFKKSPKTYLAK